MSTSETSPQGIVPEATTSGSTVAPWDKSAHATAQDVTAEPLGNATPAETEPTQPAETSETKPTEGISSEPALENVTVKPLGNATAQPAQPEPTQPTETSETKSSDGIADSEPLGNATTESAPEGVTADPIGNATTQPTEGIDSDDVTAVPEPMSVPVSVSSSVVSLSDSLRWEVLSQVARSSAVGLRLLGEYSFVRNLKFNETFINFALVSLAGAIVTLLFGSPSAPVFLVCSIVGVFMCFVNSFLIGRYTHRFESVIFDKTPVEKSEKTVFSLIALGYLMFAVFAVLHVMTLVSWGDNIEELYIHYGYLEGSVEFIVCLIIATSFVMNFLLFMYLSVRYISRSLSSDYEEFADYINNEWTLGNAIALTVKE